VDWSDTEAVAGIVGALAAVAGLWWARSAARTAKEAQQAGLPQLSVEAYIEKPRRRIRVHLENVGGAPVEVSSVAVVWASEGRRYPGHRVVPTVRLRPRSPQEDRAPDQDPGGPIVARPHGKEVVYLARLDDARFEEPRRLRVLVDVPGEAEQVVPLQPKNQMFVIEGVDAPPAS
jgi:hypothetical protein